MTWLQAVNAHFSSLDVAMCCNWPGTANWWTHETAATRNWENTMNFVSVIMQQNLVAQVKVSSSTIQEIRVSWLWGAHQATSWKFPSQNDWHEMWNHVSDIISHPRLIWLYSGQDLDPSSKCPGIWKVDLCSLAPIQPRFTMHFPTLSTVCLNLLALSACSLCLLAHPLCSCLGNSYSVLCQQIQAILLSMKWFTGQSLANLTPTVSSVR